MHDWIDCDGNDYFNKRVSTSEKYDEIVSNFKFDITERIEKANDEICSVRDKIYEMSCGNGEHYAFYLDMLERLMQSVLVDADRTNTADFMSGCRTEKFFNTADLWEQMRGTINRKLEGFSDKTDKISLQRRKISEKCFVSAKRGTGIYRMTVPTGGGKTLSGLRFAIEHCIENSLEKIIYVAPFMSILEQNSDEIRRIAGDENFLEHHSDALAEINTENELNEYELRTEKWDSPVIATTMVRFLNALFSAKMSDVRRMHRLGKAVIIIDEVQSVPMKCMNMFNLAMNFLSGICGCTIVLSSATQPVFDEIKYPLNIAENAEISGDHKQDPDVFKRTDIISALTSYGYDYNEAVDFCIEKYNSSGDLLVIVNTKSAALEMYRRFKDNVTDAEIVHLSTNMCPQYRRDSVDNIRVLLKEKRRVICITTQLIEAGVDISFNCVVRSLAGIDNIVQAAGRCNRHGENDECSPVYIINLKEERLGNLELIGKAQQTSIAVIHSNKFNDLASEEAVRAYFSKHYRDNKDELVYKTGDSDENLINLLSLNKSRYRLKKNRAVKYTGQAFKTAGSLFKVIDDNTVSVIVPYNDDAKEIISELNSGITPAYSAELLRKAQKYTIGLYRNLEKKLSDNNALYCNENGVLILRDGFYDMQYGVTADGSAMECLIM